MGHHLRVNMPVRRVVSSKGEEGRARGQRLEVTTRRMKSTDKRSNQINEFARQVMADWD